MPRLLKRLASKFRSRSYETGTNKKEICEIATKKKDEEEKARTKTRTK
jgi:hypothetical protein